MTSPVHLQPPAYNEALNENWPVDQAAADAAAAAEFDNIELTFVEGKTVPDDCDSAAQDGYAVDMPGSGANDDEPPAQDSNDVCQPEPISNIPRNSINY
jgi:hypothetical protein